MPLCRTVTLQGDISDKIQYRIGDVENILDGEWHIALSSVSLHYGNDRQEKTLITVSTNFVTQRTIDPSGKIAVEEASLGITTFGGNSENQLVTLGFRNRDFLYVNKAQHTLSVTIRNVETGARVFGAKAILLLCLKRVR